MSDGHGELHPSEPVLTPRAAGGELATWDPCAAQTVGWWHCFPAVLGRRPAPSIALPSIMASFMSALLYSPVGLHCSAEDNAFHLSR